MKGAHVRQGLSVLATIVLLLAGWQVFIWVRDVPGYLLPSPLTALAAIGEDLGLLAGRALSTLLGAALGVVVSSLLALALAVFAVRWPVLARPMTSYALVVRTLPIVGVAPLVTLVAGRGLLTSVLCVVIVTMFALYVAAVESMRATPASLNELAALYRTGLLRRVWHVQLPAAWAGLVVGFRIAIPLSVACAMLAEWLSGRPGLGSLLAEAQADRDVELLWATTVTAALLGLLSFALPGLLAAVAERRGLSAAGTDPA